MTAMMAIEQLKSATRRTIQARGWRNATAVAVAALLIACGKPASDSAAGHEPPTRLDDTGNLASIANGATVRFRTGELSLQRGAACLIDGNFYSVWSTLPEDTGQYAEIELRTRTLVRSVGATNFASSRSGRGVKTLAFSASLDGVRFIPVAEVVLSKDDFHRVAKVTPVEAHFIRVTPLTNLASTPTTEIPEIEVHGDEVERPARPVADGSWSVNTRDGSGFIERGSRLIGSIGGSYPMILEGGTDGKYFRFAWSRTNEYGLGVLAFNPEANRLTAVLFHDHTVKDAFFYTTWQGEKLGPLSNLVLPANPAVSHLQRAGSLPLFSLVFSSDGTLDARHSAEGIAVIRELLAARGNTPVQFVAHELRKASAAQNRAFTDRQIATLRTELERLQVPLSGIGFVSAGGEGITEPVDQPIQRELYSRIDLEIVQKR